MTVFVLRCPECRSTMRVAFDTPDDELPDCPVCLAAQPGGSNLDFDKPINLSIGSITDKAVKYTQKVAEEVYGLTDFRGSAGGDVNTHHAGEIGAPKLTPSQQTMKDAWDKAQSGKVTLPHMPAGGGNLMAAARAATQAAKQSGSPDPVGIGMKAIRDHGGNTWSTKNAVGRADGAGRIIRK